MIWCDHVEAILAQWIVRYLQPGDSDYKTLLDHFLLHDKRGKLISLYFLCLSGTSFAPRHLRCPLYHIFNFAPCVGRRSFLIV